MHAESIHAPGCSLLLNNTPLSLAVTDFGIWIRWIFGKGGANYSYYLAAGPVAMTGNRRILIW